MKIPLNTKTGYTINPYSGDSVQPLINYYLGDTVRTGVPVVVTGKSTCKRCLGETKQVKLGPPRQIAFPSNVRAFTISPRVARIDETRLNTYTPGDSVITLVNYSGDSIQAGVARPFHENNMPWKQPRPRPAQPPAMRDNAIVDIRYLEVDQGMASSNIYKILEDNRGILWFCTADEVSQYDGVSFRDFSGDETAWIRFARDILEDSKGNIWIASSSGVIRTNGTTYSLIRREDKNIYANDIPSLFEDSGGNIWLGSQDGIVIQFRPQSSDSPATITHHIVRTQAPFGVVSDIEEDRSGNLWFATTSDGIFRYDGVSFTHFTEDDGLPSNTVNSLSVDTGGDLWIGTASGACRYKSIDDNRSQLEVFTTREGLSNDRIHCVYPDRVGNIWLATWGGGVNQLVLNRSGAPAVIHHFGRTHGLSNDMVRTVFEDRSGNIWIGTLSGGVNLLRPRSFEHFTDIEGFTTKNIRSLCEDQHKNIWIGTEGPGIYVMSYNNVEPAGRLLEYFSADNNNIGTIYSSYEDNSGNLWFGSKDDVYFIQSSSRDPVAITRFTMRVAYDQAFTGILEGRNGDMWFGTYGGGLIRWKKSGDHLGDEVIQYTESEGFLCNFVFSMCAAPDGSLWIATDYGLCHLTPLEDGVTAQMVAYSEREGLPSNYLNTVAIDAMSDIWIGTSFDGLCRFDVPQDGETGSFTLITEKQGLSSDDIKSILPFRDTGQQLSIWASTKNGLNLLRVDSSLNETYRTYAFGRTEGLKISEFNGWGVCADSEQRIWWPGGKGMERVDAKHFRTSQNIPIPLLRSIDINNTLRHYQELPDSLRNGIAYTEVAPHENYMLDPILAYNKNTLTFHFTAIDWNAPQKIKYSHFIDGYSSTWSLPSPETNTHYRNLPPGTYTFNVRAIGESQTWSEPFAYTFTIRPPFYFSVWAYFLYGMIAFGLLYTLHRLQLKRKLEKAEQKRLLELDMLKNRLYTNITHEFRTPLTLIHGPVSLALSRNTSLEQEDLQSIHRQSERLQELIRQMLDLQKVEAGQLKPHFTYGNIVDKFRYIITLFDSWSREKQISLEFTSETEEILMDFDEEKLIQIISNLLSNAIKHTARHGTVSLSLHITEAGKTLKIRLKDTGTGIGAEDLPFIFDRYYQSSRAAIGGTGIGLALTKNLVELLKGSIRVESTLNMGTTFTLHFPIMRMSQESSSPAPVVVTSEPYDDELKFLPPIGLQSDRPVVLVIEDHPEVLQFIASCLKHEYSVMTALDGTEGIQKASEHIPDLIISDVMMPGKDGFELCAILKKDIQTSHIPIILLTGRGDHAALMEGIEHGADAYVVKPFEPAELLLRVKKLLELRAALREHYTQLAPDNVHVTPDRTSAKEHAFLEKIRTFIEEHISDPQLNMHLLCQHMAMSHPQLHRKVTALTGQSTGKFVRSVRLAKAIGLLQDSDLTVSEIAYETGFSEPGYFTKVFSKEYQMTPTEYRARLT